MVDAVMIRTFEHNKVERFAEYSSVPVINALTDDYHPCQLLADMQTYLEHRGSIQGKIVTWIGDGNNMCHSYINAAQQFGFTLNIATPDGFEPDSEIINSAQNSGTTINLMRDPLEATTGSDLVVTDVWASMGQEDESAQRLKLFSNYQVNSKLMQQANSEALFMHCLPAHRGEEVSSSVIDGDQSVVWNEAENRLHAQKALLELLLTSTDK
jgi:ornithine carbamoyltransferase